MNSFLISLTPAHRATHTYLHHYATHTYKHVVLLMHTCIIMQVHTYKHHRASRIIISYAFIPAFTLFAQLRALGLRHIMTNHIRHSLHTYIMYHAPHIFMIHYMRKLCAFRPMCRILLSPSLRGTPSDLMTRLFLLGDFGDSYG